MGTVEMAVKCRSIVSEHLRVETMMTNSKRLSGGRKE